MIDESLLTWIEFECAVCAIVCRANGCDLGSRLSGLLFLETEGHWLDCFFEGGSLGPRGSNRFDRIVNEPDGVPFFKSVINVV